MSDTPDNPIEPGRLAEIRAAHDRRRGFVTEAHMGPSPVGSSLWWVGAIADLLDEIDRLTAALAELRARTAVPEEPSCSCFRCAEEYQDRRQAIEGLTSAVLMITSGRMFCCVKCGNKRCPHAADHRNDCTRSNDTGQPGSR